MYLALDMQRNASILEKELTPYLKLIIEQDKKRIMYR